MVDLEAALKMLGWSDRHLAGLLGCTRALVGQWKSGRSSLPPVVADWLARLAAAHAANPVPQGWRRENQAAELEMACDTQRQMLRMQASGEVQKAIRSGALVKGLCQVCGADRVEAHHTDYSRPLEVVWLCPRHHRERHRQEGTGRWGVGARRRSASV